MTEVKELSAVEVCEFFGNTIKDHYGENNVAWFIIPDDGVNGSYAGSVWQLRNEAGVGIGWSFVTRQRLHSGVHQDIAATVIPIDDKLAEVCSLSAYGIVTTTDLELGNGGLAAQIAARGTKPFDDARELGVERCSEIFAEMSQPLEATVAP